MKIIILRCKKMLLCQCVDEFLTFSAFKLPCDLTNQVGGCCYAATVALRDLKCLAQ